MNRLWFLYRSYGLLYAAGLWCNRHIRPPGAFVITVILVSGILGFNLFRTLIYQVLAIGSVLFTLSVITSFFPFKTGIQILRILPDYAGVGAPLSYEIELTNLTKKREIGLVLYEENHDPRPDFDTFKTRKEPEEHLRNFWDRTTRYYRWLWLIHRNKKTGFSPVNLPELPPGETVRVKIHSRPYHRGFIHFTGLTLARPDPLGLFNRIVFIKKTQKLLVLPKRYLLDPPDLFSSRQYHAGGISLASAVGNSTEFMSLRYYRPGDPLKNIHWRTYAKTGEMVIKEFEDEYFVRHALILDTWLSNTDEPLFEAAVSIAASYVSAMQTGESILDLMFVANRCYSFPSGRGLSGTDKMIEILACVQPSPEKSIQDLVPVIKAHIKQFSGSICLFLDWSPAHQRIKDIFTRADIPVHMIIVTRDEQTLSKKIMAQNGSTEGIKIVEIDRIEKELARL